MAKTRAKCRKGGKGVTFKSKAAKKRYEAYKHIHLKKGKKKK